jgi:hypothetical protein
LIFGYYLDRFNELNLNENQSFGVYCDSFIQSRAVSGNNYPISPGAGLSESGIYHY